MKIVPERLGRVASLRGLLNKEKNLVHGKLLLLRVIIAKCRGISKNKLAKGKALSHLVIQDDKMMEA